MLFFKVLSRMFGGLFGGIGRAFMGFFRWLGRHEMALGITTVAVIGVFAIWILLSLLNVNIVFGQPQAVAPAASSAPATETPTPTPPPQPSVAPVSRTDAPAATEAFMVGQVNGNADQVWNALSATLHNRLAGQGQDKTYFQRLFENQKKNGLVYESYQYVAGVAGDNGTSIHFYVMTVISPDKKVNRIPWTFIVDKEGKITSIDSAA